MKVKTEEVEKDKVQKVFLLSKSGKENQTYFRQKQTFFV